MIERRHLLGMAAGLLAGVLTLTAPAHAQPKDLVIFAAASLKNALDETAAAWAKETGSRPRKSPTPPAAR